ncbi:unnamed protein product [Pneumocystis jirovecii]|uniref:Uncharacterized protein n=2 Tax=Pneumocystis jirovecii TaxID=42068 RepID=L0PF96_PNEJI|nr:uncharacterized protein T551_03519 [Pneumocystis jirovecii RU7]KTW26219.1 hypothetical protein T551_03519 [Pneumocystis jirovecii RU7]CCJ31043.1 unnamed protein product [Pneumocystis jirovecii]
MSHQIGKIEHHWNDPSSKVFENISVMQNISCDTSFENIPTSVLSNTSLCSSEVLCSYIERLMHMPSTHSLHLHNMLISRINLYLIPYLKTLDKKQTLCLLTAMEYLFKARNKELARKKIVDTMMHSHDGGIARWGSSIRALIEGAILE